MMTEAKAGFRAFNDGAAGTPRGGLHRAAPAPRARRDVGRRAVPRDRAEAGASAAGEAADDVRIATRFDGALGQIVIDRPKANIVSLAVIEGLRDGARARLGAARPARDDRRRRRSLQLRRGGRRARAGDDRPRPRRARQPGPRPAGLGGADRRGRARPLPGRRLRDRARLRLPLRRRHGRSSACPRCLLGVFPPLAAAILPVRVGASRAAEAVITGEPRGVVVLAGRRPRRAHGARRGARRRGRRLLPRAPRAAIGRRALRRRPRPAASPSATRSTPCCRASNGSTSTT